MEKRAGKKYPTHHKKHHTHEEHMEHTHTQHDEGINKVMLENFVSLQKVMTNLSFKLDNLTTQISKLLEIFEISAKALAEKDFEVEKDNKEVLDKMNILLDQNKVLARGLSLMHERIPPERTPQPTMQPTQFSPPSYIKEMNSPQQRFTRPLSQEIPDSQSNPPRFKSPIES